MVRLKTTKNKTLLEKTNKNKKQIHLKFPPEALCDKLPSP